MSKSNRCVISGTDIYRLPFGFNEDSRECQKVKTRLLHAITALHKNGVDEFYTDCGLGFPLWGGEIVTGLMNYNNVKLFVCFPYEDQPYKYAENWRERFFKVHELCTEVFPIYVKFDDENKNFDFSDENEEELVRRGADYMLEKCGKMLFGGDGDGLYIYDEARKRGLEIYTLEMV
ncbi:MAG: DUF1273 domain-containing protein [Oscillospiraceae bacterium]|jgi:uncharacterized phage-like protein YoqJ|nr:DUF1273 domain-containing protein [Oscillospiraceae bacterium]